MLVPKENGDRVLRRRFFDPGRRLTDIQDGTPPAAQPPGRSDDQRFSGRRPAQASVHLHRRQNVPGPGGETQFLYQDISVTPERGKLVLFPPFWTHEHRAARLEAGVKYIATTWVVFA